MSLYCCQLLYGIFCSSNYQQLSYFLNLGPWGTNCRRFSRLIMFRSLVQMGYNESRIGTITFYGILSVFPNDKIMQCLFVVNLRSAVLVSLILTNIEEHEKSFFMTQDVAKMDNIDSFNY